MIAHLLNAVSAKYREGVAQQYTELMKPFDVIQNELVREHCNDCKSHCCVTDASEVDVSSELLGMQHKEADESTNDKKRGGHCIYGSTEGCDLTYSKSPLCAGLICSTVEQALLKDYDPEVAQEFIDASVSVKRGSIKYNHEKLFSDMERAINAGMRLIRQNT